MKKVFVFVLTLVFALSCLTAFATENTIVVGASSTPHAEILEFVKPALADRGWELKVVVFDDFILPNLGLDDGSLDANYFQHEPYLKNFNAGNGTDLSNAACVHYEPFGLYANGVSSVEEVQPGATIFLPADDSNETRALFLLQQVGLIELEADADPEAGVSTLDVKDDKGYDLRPLPAETVPAQLANSAPGTLAVINGNYALQAGLDVANALAVEDATGDAALTYSNILAVRTEDLESEKTQVLVEVLLTEEVRAYIEENYNGAVVAIF